MISLNLAVLGAGYMGKNHIRVFSGISDVNLIAICDKDLSKSQKLSKQYKIKAYSNFYDLLNEEKLHAISICLPTTLHFEAAKLALNRGIDVFIEKPICSTPKEAKLLIKYAKKNKRRIMIGHIERFNPVVTEIKQRIKSGELGKILKIQTQRFSPPTGRAQDVSAIIDLATHDIDVIQYLLGEKPIRVYSETNSRLHKKEDLMSALMRFKGGTIGLVEVSWLHPNKIRSLVVLGENGMYIADYITQELFFYRQNENIFNYNHLVLNAITQADVIKIAFEAREPLQIELESFIRSLRSNTEMLVSGDDGLSALELAQKMINSGKKHKLLK